MKKSNLVCTVLASAALAWGLTAGASPVLRMIADDNLLTKVQVGDGDAPNDKHPTAGWVTYIGPVGSNWMVTTTGVGSPYYTTPHLDFNSISASNVVDEQNFGGNHLDLYLSDTGFSLSSIAEIVNFLGSIGGTTRGMVTWDMFIDDTDTLFGTQQQIGITGSNGPIEFSGSVLEGARVDGTFSMTLHVRINHGNGEKTSSFNFEGVGQRERFARLVPEPGTALLLGLGLFGLAWIRRRSA